MGGPSREERSIWEGDFRVDFEEEESLVRAPDIKREEIMARAGEEMDTKYASTGKQDAQGLLKRNRRWEPHA